MAFIFPIAYCEVYVEEDIDVIAGGEKYAVLSLFFFFFFVFLLFLWATPTAYGGYQARGPIGAVATGLCHSHSNAGSQPRLQPTPQVMAMLDP